MFVFLFCFHDKDLFVFTSGIGILGICLCGSIFAIVTLLAQSHIQEQLPQLNTGDISFLLEIVLWLSPLSNSSHQTLLQRQVEVRLVHLLENASVCSLEALTLQQRLTLRKLLSRPNEPLLLAVLSSIEKNPQHQDVTPVRKLAHGEWFAAKSCDVKTAAQHCLQTIEAILAQQNERTNLLRASAPAQSPGELLRAAEGTRSTPEADAQLLPSYAWAGRDLRSVEGCCSRSWIGGRQ